MLAQNGMDRETAQNSAIACLKKYVAENWDYLDKAGIDPEEISASLP
jgi:hypothetical protein